MKKLLHAQQRRERTVVVKRGLRDDEVVEAEDRREAESKGLPPPPDWLTKRRPQPCRLLVSLEHPALEALTADDVKKSVRRAVQREALALRPSLSHAITGRGFRGLDRVYGDVLSAFTLIATFAEIMPELRKDAEPTMGAGAVAGENDDFAMLRKAMSAAAVLVNKRKDATADAGGAGATGQKRKREAHIFEHRKALLVRSAVGSGLLPAALTPAHALALVPGAASTPTAASVTSPMLALAGAPCTVGIERRFRFNGTSRDGRGAGNPTPVPPRGAAVRSLEGMERILGVFAGVANSSGGSANRIAAPAGSSAAHSVLAALCSTLLAIQAGAAEKKKEVVDQVPPPPPPASAANEFTPGAEGWRVRDNDVASGLLRSLVEAQTAEAAHLSESARQRAAAAVEAAAAAATAAAAPAEFSSATAMTKEQLGAAMATAVKDATAAVAERETLASWEEAMMRAANESQWLGSHASLAAKRQRLSSGVRGAWQGVMRSLLLQNQGVQEEVSKMGWSDTGWGMMGESR